MSIFRIGRWVAVCTLIVASTCSTVSAQIPEHERGALIALYNATDGANWTTRTNWRNASNTDFRPPGTECWWYGISCLYGDPSHVYQIYLVNNNLNGFIPPELANLTELRALTLPGNDLGEEVPSYVVTFSSVTLLNLSECGLTGGFPIEITKMPALRSLNLRSNDLSGPLPTELSQMRKLTSLELGWNRFSGEIPIEIGDMDVLGSLDLRSNQLTGPIPSSIQYLSSLYEIFLSGNRFSGQIPPEIGTLSRLSAIVLDDNRFSGPIPSEFGNLTRLRRFSARGNLLSGAIPVEITNTQLADPSATGLILSWNALYIDDPTVQTFIDEAHWETYEFEGTQTIAPANLVIESVSDHTVWLSWDPILYLEDGGGYTVFRADIGAETWVRTGFSSSKDQLRFPVTSLDPGTTYDIAVASYTNPHKNNLNLVASNLSAPTMTTTSDTGCAAPTIVSDPQFGRRYSLSASGSFDSYEWSTGETTESVIVSPEAPTTYWVRVTSAGPCDEAAVITLDPTLVFRDGFESGDHSMWNLVTN